MGKSTVMEKSELMGKSVETWAKMLKGKTEYQAARIILADMIGYRKTSLHRAEDIDSLTAAIIAIIQLVDEEHY